MIGDELQKDFFVRLKVGRVQDIDIENNKALVKVSDEPGDSYDCYVSHPLANNGDETASEASKRYSAWGIFGFPSVNSYVLIFQIQNQIAFILATIPPRLGYTLWREQNKLKMNRIPIATADKRQEDQDRGISEDLLKWGEVLMRSVGLGDIMLDYKGNVLVDTSKQTTIRVGDRDSDNKISSPELTISVGRVVDSNGAEKTLGGRKIKIEILDDSNNPIIQIDEDNKVVITSSDIKLGSNSATEPMVLGNSFKAIYDAHIHPTPAGPSSPPVVPMPTTNLSTKIKGEY